jgi:hypothetical protein
VQGQSQPDPKGAAKLAHLNALNLCYQQRDFIIETGWATVPMSVTEIRDLGSVLYRALEASADLTRILPSGAHDWVHLGPS